MRAVVETAMLFAALLADVLLGNRGFSPCLTMFVLFHASRCVSLRFATVGALFLGVVIDALYCRTALRTPLWYVLALYAGQAVSFRLDDDGLGRALQIVQPGAAIGGVLALRQLSDAWPELGAGYWSIAFELLFGVVSGVLKLTLAVLATDIVCERLGVRGYFPREREGGDVSERGGRRRIRRVRAEKVMGKRS